MTEIVHVSLDREACIGSGMCVVYAPGTFAQDDEAKSVILHDSDEPADVIRAAVEACPTGALRLVSTENRR